MVTTSLFFMLLGSAALSYIIFIGGERTEDQH
jgi:hypothetical protein